MDRYTVVFQKVIPDSLFHLKKEVNMFISETVDFFE